MKVTQHDIEALTDRDLSTVMISNSTVVIGNHAGGEIAASAQTGQQLDINEQEILRIFNSLPIRLKVEFFQQALALEDRHLESK